MSIITPKPMSGFPELSPEQQLVFNRCARIVRETYELYGFTPIETPSVERVEVLTRKGGEEKEIYAISRLFAEKDEGEKPEFALHFDLTVPLARYVAQHKEKLVFPFRRYQIQKVWRGERAQKGRYREFYQCDIDVIGRGSVSIGIDAEIPAVIYDVFTRMNIGPFVIRMNNRRLLQGFFEHVGVAGERIGDVLRSVDRLEKIGHEKVLADLVHNIGLSETQAVAILEFTAKRAETDALFAFLKEQSACMNAVYAQGLAELESVMRDVRNLGVPDKACKLDLSIARGLGYYTGTVYETQLLDHPDLGSICSGGRYDDLASYFTNEKLPGVGISIGLSRLVFELLDRAVLKTAGQTPARALVTTLDKLLADEYLKIARELRAAGIATEVYVESKGLGDQLKYASRKGFEVAVIAGGDEMARNVVKVKNLAAGTEKIVLRSQLAAQLVGSS